MHINLLRLETESRFEEFCQALLREEYDHLVSLSAPDRGMDAYDPDHRTIFQAYFPERSPRKDKIQGDLEKAAREAWTCDQWVLLLPKDPTPALRDWLTAQQPRHSFRLTIWGKTEILRLLARHRSVREAYFPTELGTELRRLAKGKRPRAGDALPGAAIAPEHREELREWINELAEAAAERKHRKPQGYDFQREWGELDAHFDISGIDRLPEKKYAEAREYLQQKFYARRTGEPQRATRYRLVGGIKALQKKLNLDDATYRAILQELTGKTSTTQMDNKELTVVRKHLQGIEGGRLGRS